MKVQEPRIEGVGHSPAQTTLVKSSVVFGRRRNIYIGKQSFLQTLIDTIHLYLKKKTWPFPLRNYFPNQHRLEALHLYLELGMHPLILLELWTLEREIQSKPWVGRLLCSIQFWDISILLFPALRGTNMMFPSRDGAQRRKALKMFHQNCYWHRLVREISKHLRVVINPSPKPRIGSIVFNFFPKQCICWYQNCLYCSP